MKNLLKKIGIALSLFALIPTAAAAQSKENTMENDRFAPLGKDIMPIGAWVAPPPAAIFGQNNPSYITKESYKLAKDAGLNMVYGLYETADSRPADVMQALDAAQANGLKYMVRDLSIEAAAGNSNAMKHLLEAYSKHPAYIGNLATDEPATPEFDSLAAIYKTFQKIAPDKYFYVNLLPNYASKNQLFINKTDGGGGAPSTEDYENYLDQYVSKVKPAFLSYDHYPMWGEFPYLNPGYFENMSAVRKTAAKNNIPFWVFIQDASWSSGVRLPKPAETFWQVNTALAYGAQGIQYFTFWCPYEPGFTGGMVTRTGDKTPIYDDVQKMNKQIAAIDHVLMNAVSKGVIVHGDSPVPVPQGDRLESYKELTSLSGGTPVLVGAFDYKDKSSAYYVVNNTINQDGDLTLNFSKPVQAQLYQDAKKSEQSSSAIKLHLAAGEGVLVVVK
jgi:hypothetical protein